MPDLSTVGIPKTAPRRKDVDISPAFDEPAKTTILTFQDPNTAQVFQINELIPNLKKKNPDWSNMLCRSVALLAVSHAAPNVDPKDPLQVYEDMANSNKELFDYVVTQYMEAFPKTIDFDAAIESAKKA